VTRTAAPIAGTQPAPASSGAYLVIIATITSTTAHNVAPKPLI
jgi:hypothetical protein